MERSEGTRTLIIVAVLTMALFILVLAIHSTWRASEDFHLATESTTISEISMHLVRASDIRAIERGYTSGALASGASHGVQLLEKIKQLRQSGDRHNKKAIELIKKLRNHRPDDFALKVAELYVIAANSTLQKARDLVDRQLSEGLKLITPQEWFNLITEVITHGRHLRDSLSSAVIAAPLNTHPYWTVRHWAWRISENAGRERALLAIHIAGNKPISNDSLEQLDNYRAVVGHELGLLSTIKIQSGVDRRLIHAIETMETVFSDEYEAVRKSIYSAAKDGNYPLTRDHWLNTATDAINSILTVSEACSLIIEESVNSMQQVKSWVMRLYFFLLAITLGLVIFTIHKVKQTTDRLIQSKLIAESTSYELEAEICERQNLEKVLRSSQESFRSLVMQNPTGIVVIDPAGDGLFSNSAAQNMLGKTEEELNTKRIPIPLLVGYRKELTINRSDGSQGTAEATVTDTEWEDRHAILVSLHDISERTAAEREIEYISYHDPLTGLPNRRLFVDRVDHAVARTKRAENMVAVLFVDVDGFKIINDTLGHAVGDELIRHVAYKLINSVREGDTVARTGGDEFSILLEGLKHLDEITSVTSKLHSTLSESVDLYGHSLHLSACIGSCVFPIDTDNADALIRQANTAISHAKEEGRGKTKRYTADMGNRFSARLKLESRLRKAVENNEFFLHYQPQINIDDNKIVGAEALLRWKDPVHGQVSPSEFVPILEDTGLIVTVGAWALHAACSQNKKWQEAGLDSITIAVNVSPIQFGLHQMAGVVREALDNTALPPKYLELEITENALMDNPAACSFILKELYELGVKTAIDDFGTGYSSLSYLKQFPVHKLKIDRSFIMDLPNDINDASITRAVLALGKSLQLKVLAEGVETEEQLLFLRDHGCEEVQGYYFSTPVPADELEQLLNKQSSRNFPAID
ncbi:MAG: bifunctional diguanylate cyclase/phosphodiesterase [Sedimenticola sp.]